MKIQLLFWISWFFWVSVMNADAKIVSPLNFGLPEANNGIDRFWALTRCHKYARENGAAISYQDIDTLRLDIPYNAQPIPLTNYVDFAGVTLIVSNCTHDCFLFELTDTLQNIQLSGVSIDRGDFRTNPLLSRGMNLLVVEDENPWCRRKGYATNVIRRDAMVITDGFASNLPVSSYASSYSKPKAWYRIVSPIKKEIKNLKFIRTPESTYKTYCIKVENQYNVELSNIFLLTPEDSLRNADKAIHCQNCVKLTLKSISINGTYSQVRKYGYGISLNNISNLNVQKMYARSKWGVFGTNCLNNVILINCDINRFDIHCYGRDVKALKCKFTRLYNQISSVYGKVSFDRCEFKDFTPLLIESSYNAYTPFDLEFKRCVFFLDNTHNFIMTLFGVPQAYNARPELRRKSLPNIIMKDCTVHIPGDVKNWMLVKTGGNYYKDSFDYITNIDIKNVKTVGNNTAVLDLFSEEVKTSERINVRMR